MTEQDFLTTLENYGQHHILEHYRALTPHQRGVFLEASRGLDIRLVMKLHRQFDQAECASPVPTGIRPPRVVCVPRTSREQNGALRARSIGESLLQRQKVAVLVVAGGQGSRLGFDGPKGTFPLSPVKRKTLFQLFAEQVRYLSVRFGVTIPFLIMTSTDNHEDTVQFFQANRHFGLAPDSVHFFSQGVLPAVSPDGRLILRDNVHFYTSPNGHGGSLKALSDSGLLAKLIAAGYEDLFYCQVDNPLVRIADPVFLGHHSSEAAQVSTKVVRRRSVDEKVGVYLDVNGRQAVIEYSDLDESHMQALDEKGEILYWAGNTAIHIFSLSFIRDLNTDGFALPYHCARKSAYVVSSDWEPASIDVWKFETFVFDAIPLAERACCMEVAREEEFAPVKNKEGPDSPDTARQALIELHRAWLKKAGVEVPPDAKVEVSPLFAFTPEEAAEKLRTRKVVASPEIYIE
ncbi:MAG TPA: UTP--glucose-1-phosphate uridylyltransferase [Syntrophorhabdaceae bacterium]|nr:UDPGP type 1 family protein [Syntrophorhabdus sp.]HNT43131.1 UTP--glucose-1-phosphate uridylyltransferase [Syntrophorhabdaceae bacterium]